MYSETELIRSDSLSTLAKGNVWLKMENQQFSGSFKYRGISLLCQKAVANGCTKFISSSGGNAGLAAAHAAKVLKIPITVYVPETIFKLTKDKLIELGATVIVHGKVWDEANAAALEAAKAPEVQFIHPFDDPIIWEGHSSVISESKRQLGGVIPDLVIISVGGGGLMNGVLRGLHENGWGHVPLLAMETKGADSLNACVRANEWVGIPEISSVAKCLGALKVSQRTFQWLGQHKIISQVVSDNAALNACVRFSDDHDVLVPPACGAALSAIYSGVVRELISDGKLPESSLQNVLLIVCGGSGINKTTIEKWRKELGN